MSKITFITAALTLTTLTATAQSLDETFNVEGIFKADITKQERIAQTPTSMDLQLTHPGLQYSDAGVPVQVSPYLTPLPAAGWLDTYEYDRSRGYLDLGIGSYLDITGSAGVRLIDNDRTRLGIRLQHNSSTAFRPYKEDIAGQKPQSRRLFDEYLGIYGSHIFDGTGRLDASVNYRMGYYNYYGMQSTVCDPQSVPTQTTNSLDISARFTSDNAHRLRWNAGVEYDYYGYRRMYLPGIEQMPGLKQNLLAIDGGVAYPLGYSSAMNQAIGLDLRADIVTFSDHSEFSIQHSALSNYSRYRLAPHYTVTGSKFSGRIGACIDLMAGAGPAADRYPTFRISPDIYAGYRSGRFGIGLQMGGGVELNTLQRNAALYRYTTPWLASTAPIYSPIDGRLALSLGSFSGLSAELAFAYKVTDGQPLEGWYPQILSGIYTSDENSIDIHGYSLQAKAAYTYRNLFEVSAVLSYQPQHGERGYFNGLDRPRWLLDTKLAVTPLKGLKIDLQYQYRGVRSLYGTDDASELMWIRLPDITDLSLGASYDLMPQMLTLWLRADNLLGTEAYLNPMMPTPGVAVMGGIALKF